MISKLGNKERTVYDMFYVVLARRNNAVLVSRAPKLVKVAEKMGVEAFS
jgi:predicted nucleic acid-binding protein